MKQKLSAAVWCAIIILSGFGVSAQAAEPVTAKSFARADGTLDQQAAAFYIVYRDQEPLSKFVAPGQTTIDPQKVIDTMADKLDDLRSKTGHTSPWTWQELDAAYPPKKTGEQPDATVPAWKKIDGLTEKLELKKGQRLESLGPILLRNSAADLTKSLSDAKGATLAYSRNGLNSGSGALNSQGVLDYPTMWDLYQGGHGRSVEMGLDFASEWNIAQVQTNHAKDVEELTFSTPVTVYLSPGAWLRGDDKSTASPRASSGLFLFQSKPYFQTDFGFQDEIYGVDANLEYVGSVFGSRVLYLGGFQNLGALGLQYQLRLIPNLDYSVTARGGVHTTRKAGDDWVRPGGTGSLDLRLGLQTFNALDAGVSYQFLETVSGSGGYSHLFTAHTTLWLIENVGMTFQYSNGETPVANQPINLITLGLEFKY